MLLSSRVTWICFGCATEGVRVPQDKHVGCQELAADRLRFVMRTPTTAAAATAAGVLPLLLFGMLHESVSVRRTYYSTLLEGLRHEQQRQEVVNVVMDGSSKAVQRLLRRAFPTLRIEIAGSSSVSAVTFLLACAMSEVNSGWKQFPTATDASIGAVSALPLQLLEKLAQVQRVLPPRIYYLDYDKTVRLDDRLLLICCSSNGGCAHILPMWCRSGTIRVSWRT